MSKVKGLSRVDGDGARVIGDPSQATVAVKAKRAPMELRKRQWDVKCCDCDYVAKFSSISIKNLGKKKWRCRECKPKAQQSVNQAILAVAARKKQKKTTR